MIALPKSHVLVTYRGGETAIWRIDSLTLTPGTVVATVLRETRSLADMEAWLEREPLAPPVTSR